MPRSKKPERYPGEFADLSVTAVRQGHVTIPTSTVSEAFGLRTKLYSYWAAVDAQIHDGPEALARRLVSARRIELAPGEDATAPWVIERCKDLLAAAADLEATVQTSPPLLLVARKENNRFTQLIRSALGTAQGEDSAAASLKRLLELQQKDTSQ
jgi:hypothetical protein